jgi:hypothetical protein
MNLKTLCIQLARSDSESEIIKILKDVGYWKADDAWRYYGDQENNFATIGNQQSRPEAALVEKLINSVDAVLMAECLKRGIDPTSNKAPSSIKEAQQEYFEINNGRLSNITASRRAKLAQNIGLVATGQKSNPSYAVFDTGEGQTPKMMPETLLSIGKSNKLRIPFVQGKFNMGGTGVFQFCGDRNLQLIVSKRHPKAASDENDETSDFWGFTIVRREDPAEGIRNSVYKYLAPNNQILRFKSEELPLIPADHPNPFGIPMSWGTYIKMYEYQMTGMRTNILFDLYNSLSLLMPSVALPIRFYERRDYKGHSLETTLAGLTVRVEEDKRDNLEEEFSTPPSSTISVMGQTMNVSIYAFRKDAADKYRKNEGIVFTVNGQTHGYLSKRFFSRQAVGLGYLSDSLLVLVDCTGIEGRAREDLFMNSRDRLRSGELRSRIERNLENLLRNHQGLKDLNSRRRREATENKLDDSKPLADIIETVLEKSPTLSKLFIEGLRLPNPYDTRKVKKLENYEGKRFPTHFKLVKDYSIDNPKKSPINRRLRIQYKTDASNDYFDRDKDPGEFFIKSNVGDIRDFTINLWNGTATLNLSLPEDTSVGDLIHFESVVSDISKVDPFAEDFYIEVIPKVKKKKSKRGKRKPPASDEEGNDVDQIQHLNLPNIIEIRKDEWDQHNFNQKTALNVVHSGEEGYDFYVNMHNIHLVTEKKANDDADPKLIDAKYKYGLVLVGLAMLKEYNDKEVEDNRNGINGSDIFEDIRMISKALSPIIIPMIDGLGELNSEEIK